MEPSEAIAFVRRYNAWRRGGEMDQPQPYQIGQAIDALCDHAERMGKELQDRAESWRMSSVCRAKEAVIARLESELEQERQDRKQADLDAIRALGERNDERAELEQIKATLANPHAVHLNMLRGTIQWTPANLRHLMGEP